MVIVSIYDSGCDFSVMVDNKIYSRNCIDRNICDKVFSEYTFNLYENFSNWLKQEFPDKTIIICEDGQIDIIQQ